MKQNIFRNKQNMQFFWKNAMSTLIWLFLMKYALICKNLLLHIFNWPSNQVRMFVYLQNSKLFKFFGDSEF